MCTNRSQTQAHSRLLKRIHTHTLVSLYDVIVMARLCGGATRTEGSCSVAKSHPQSIRTVRFATSLLAWYWCCISILQMSQWLPGLDAMTTLTTKKPPALHSTSVLMGTEGSVRRKLLRLFSWRKYNPMIEWVIGREGYALGIATVFSLVMLLALIS